MVDILRIFEGGLLGGEEADDAAFAETRRFVPISKTRRQPQRGKISILGAEAFAEHRPLPQGKARSAERFRPYLNRAPAHDQLGDVFATLHARALTRTPSPALFFALQLARRLLGFEN
jgi:hypothetical protein